MTAVVDDKAPRLEDGEIVINELQLASVSIRRHFMTEYALAKIENSGLSRFPATRRCSGGLWVTTSSLAT